MISSDLKKESSCVLWENFGNDVGRWHCREQEGPSSNGTSVQSGCGALKDGFKESHVLSGGKIVGAADEIQNGERCNHLRGKI